MRNSTKKPINFYNRKYYEEHEFSYTNEERMDIKRILKLLKIKTGDRVLDIGCGLGILLEKISARKKVGIETNNFAINKCKEKGLKVMKLNADNGLPFKNASFDIVIMNEVISHVTKPQFVLKECFRVLRPNGIIALTTPVRSLFFHNISPTHLNEYSTEDIRNLIEKSGFKITSHEVCGISFIYPLLENLLYKPFRLLRERLEKNKKQQLTAKVEEKFGTIDNLRKFLDNTLFKPLSTYRKFFLSLGLNQLLVAKKRS